MELAFAFLLFLMTIAIIAIVVYVFLNMPSRQQVLRIQREMNEERSGREKCMEELNRFFVLVAKMSLKLEDMENPRTTGRGEGERAGHVWEQIAHAYNEAELRIFLHDYFQIELEVIISQGSGKEKALELVKYFQRRNQLDRLIEALKTDRGGWEWKM